MKKAPVFWGLFCLSSTRFECGLRRYQADEVEPVFEHAQDALQIVAAFHDQAAGGDDAVGALLARQAHVLFDTIERVLARFAIDGEDRLVAQEIDRVIAPNSRGDLAAVEIEDGGKLVSSKVVRRPGSQRLCASGVARLPAGRGRKRIGSVVSLKPASSIVAGSEDRANTSGMQERTVSIADWRMMSAATFGTEIPLDRTNSRPRAGHNLPH